jgi:hypothetical protein
MQEDSNMINRTEEVRDIIERIPQRFGRIVIFIVVSLSGFLLFFGWIIEYPEKVSGPVSITAKHAPIKLVANSSGRLHLIKNNSDALEENEIFAFVDNSAKLMDVLSIEEYLYNNNPDSLYNNPIFINESSTLSLGELSIQYFNFLNSLEKVSQYRKGRPYDKKVASLKSLLYSQSILRKKNIEQLITESNTVKIAEKSVHRDSVLFQSSTIAEIDIDRSSIEFFGILEKKQSMEKDNTSLGIQIEDTRYKLQSLALEQRDTESRLRMDLLSDYNGLIAGIRKWKQTYCFTSPIKGSLEFLNFWRENDFISMGTGVFSILPKDNPILGQVYLPSYGAGKVVVGQEVIIKLENFPFLEFGTLKGRVKTISQLSSQSPELAGQTKTKTYLITLELPTNLTTNYGAQLDFRYEINGIADILINRRKLLERLFDNLKYIASKK